MTKQEYETIVKWDSDQLLVKETAEIFEENASIPSVSFDIELDPNKLDLVFENEDILIDQIMTALASDDHIIFTGPPGTGKSKLAKKVCQMYGIVLLAGCSFRMEPSKEAYDDYYFQYSNNPDEFDYVQIKLNATNTSEEKVNFNPISTVVTNDGQQLEFPNDEMAWDIQQLHGDYYGGVTKEGHMAYVLPKGMDEPFEWIKLYTSSVHDEDFDKLEKLKSTKNIAYAATGMYEMQDYIYLVRDSEDNYITQRFPLISF